MHSKGIGAARLSSGMEREVVQTFTMKFPANPKSTRTETEKGAIKTISEVGMENCWCVGVSFGATDLVRPELAVGPAVVLFPAVHAQSFSPSILLLL